MPSRIPLSPLIPFSLIELSRHTPPPIGPRWSYLDSHIRPPARGKKQPESCCMYSEPWWRVTSHHKCMKASWRILNFEGIIAGLRHNHLILSLMLQVLDFVLYLNHVAYGYRLLILGKARKLGAKDKQLSCTPSLLPLDRKIASKRRLPIPILSWTVIDTPVDIVITITFRRLIRPLFKIRLLRASLFTKFAKMGFIDYLLNSCRLTTSRVVPASAKPLSSLRRYLYEDL